MWRFLKILLNFAQFCPNLVISGELPSRVSVFEVQIISTCILNCQLAQVNLSSVEASVNNRAQKRQRLMSHAVLGGGEWNAANDDAATSNGPYDGAALHDDASPTTNGDATTANGDAATTNGDPAATNGDASDGNATYDASTATSIASHDG